MKSFEKQSSSTGQDDLEALFVKEKEIGRLEDEKEKLLAQIEKLKHDLIHDQLTGLKERNFLTDRIHEILSNLAVKEEHRHVREYETLAIIFCDLDNFKQINDIYGHEAGDEVLKKVSKIFINNLRETDIASRWGGEEIVLALVNADQAGSLAKAEELRQLVEDLEFPDYPGLKVTVSMGLSIAKQNDNFKPSELVRQADMAMYQAKGQGKNRVILAS